MEDAAVELIDGLLLMENAATELADRLPLIRVGLYTLSQLAMYDDNVYWLRYVVILVILYITCFSWDVNLLYSTPLGTFIPTIIISAPSMHLTPFTVVKDD